MTNDQDQNQAEAYAFLYIARSYLRLALDRLADTADAHTTRAVHSLHDITTTHIEALRTTLTRGPAAPTPPAQN